MLGHGVDGGEGGIRGAFADGRVVAGGHVGGGRAGRRWGVLAQLLPDDHQVFILFQDLPWDVARVAAIVHVISGVRTHFRPVGVIQPTRIQTHSNADWRPFIGPLSMFLHVLC